MKNYKMLDKHNNQVEVKASLVESFVSQGYKLLDDEVLDYNPEQSEVKTEAIDLKDIPDASTELTFDLLMALKKDEMIQYGIDLGLSIDIDLKKEDLANSILEQIQEG